MNRKVLVGLTAIVLIALIAAACGESATPTPGPSPVPTAAVLPSPSAVPTPPLAQSELSQTDNTAFDPYKKTRSK